MAVQLASFRRKLPLVWKQLMLAMLAEETVSWKIQQLCERE